MHVQLIKKLLRDVSHPMTSKPQESFTYLELWINSAALSEQERDDIADKDRQDIVVLTPIFPQSNLTKLAYKTQPSPEHYIISLKMCSDK